MHPVCLTGEALVQPVRLNVDHVGCDCLAAFLCASKIARDKDVGVAVLVYAGDHVNRAARLEAERYTLLNVRARGFDVAARWTEMADQLSWVEREGRLRADATVKRFKP